MSTRRKSRMYTCIVLGFGYAEDSSLSNVWFMSDAGFATPQDALKDLALQIYGKYKVDHIPKRNPCCLSVRENNSNFKFCPYCGFSTNSLMDFEEYNLWLLHISTYTIDTWRPTTELDGWSSVSIWDLIKSGMGTIVNVPDRAEYCLIAALNPKSIDEEDQKQLIEYQEYNNLDPSNLSCFFDNIEN